jgi:hypothetical protein
MTGPSWVKLAPAEQAIVGLCVGKKRGGGLGQLRRRGPRGVFQISKSFLFFLFDLKKSQNEFVCILLETNTKHSINST